MEADLSEFEEISRTHPTRCKLGRVLDDMEDSQEKVNLVEAVTVALPWRTDGGKRVGHKTIAAWLRRRRIEMDDSTVRLHRTGKCVCFRAVTDG